MGHGARHGPTSVLTTLTTCPCHERKMTPIFARVPENCDSWCVSGPIKIERKGRALLGARPARK